MNIGDLHYGTLHHLNDHTVLLESRHGLLYGLASDRGVVFLRIVTINEDTGETELRCALGDHHERPGET